MVSIKRQIEAGLVSVLWKHTTQVVQPILTFIITSALYQETQNHQEMVNY